MTTQPTRDDMLHDVWDGAALTSHSDPHHLALSLSTDGVPLFKSSKVSLWPVYLVILNLPANIRMNSENVVLSGMWVGPAKPEMSLLLDPVIEHLKHLSSTGMVVHLPSGDVVIRAELVMGVFDLPAKAAVLCSKQFNGEFGCSVCLHKGKRLPNNSRIYLPDEACAERSNLEVLNAAVLAERTHTPVQGVYGTSALANIIDLVNSVPVDYMHCVLEGVTRWLTNAWFDSKNHNKPFYIGRRVREIDFQLLKQRPPSEFSRPPRSIQSHLKY